VRQCPKCGSPRIHRSRSRGLLEQIRKTVTSRRPHRCHACGWRGWGVETQEPATPELPTAIRPAPDLDVIDTIVSGGGRIEPAPGGGHRSGRQRKSKSSR
jgi:hypothetical protein